MAKAKKRIGTRRKSSKRGKISKAARKKASRRTKRQQTRPKLRGAAKQTKKQWPSKIAAKKAQREMPRGILEVPVEDTIIDVVEEPVPGVVVVSEYETVRMTIPNPSSPEPKLGIRPETEEE